MRIISKSIDFRAQDELLQGIAPLSDFLLLDIETTGLSAEHNAVYLIGCIYHQTDGWNLIQRKFYLHSSCSLPVTGPLFITTATGSTFPF